MEFSGRSHEEVVSSYPGDKMGKLQNILFCFSSYDADILCCVHLHQRILAIVYNYDHKSKAKSAESGLPVIYPGANDLPLLYEYGLCSSLYYHGCCTRKLSIGEAAAVLVRYGLRV